MSKAVNIPVIADGDTGYGNAVNVMRAAREFERSGATYIQLEDQVAPKKCGHMLGREVISKDEMVNKLIGLPEICQMETRYATGRTIKTGDGR